jgi:hypothetical protein
MLAAETVARLAERLPGAFDRVLLDAPCSGEGLFRRNPAAAAQWRPGHVRGSADRQRALLAAAAALVRPGGVLVYSTCTFAPEENEQQVAGFLAAHPDWELLEIPAHEGFTPGRPDWSPDGPPELARTVRLWPHHLRGEGHFIAKLARPGSGGRLPTGPSPTGPLPAGPGAGRQAVVDAWRGFAADALEEEPAGVTVVGERAYLVPDPEVAGAGVRLVRPGLLAGRVRPGRFEPAHALAMAVGVAVARRGRRLDDAEAAAWVRGAGRWSAVPAGRGAGGGRPAGASRTTTPRACVR